MSLRDELLEIWMKIEPFNRGLKGGEEPDGHGAAARGLKYVDAAAHSLNGFRKIDGTALNELRPKFVANHFERHGRESVARKRFSRGLKMRQNAEGRGQTGFQMNIAGAPLTGEANETG